MAKRQKNIIKIAKFLYFEFQCVPINMESQLKICTSYLDYSQI
jgi:hypothetical protein